MEMWSAPEVVIEGELEVWKPVAGFIRYEVSNLGRFRRKLTGKILLGTLKHTGYMHIGLMKDGDQIWKLSHRMVAEAFLEKPSPKHNDVHHKNKIKTDNWSGNLEWLTRSEHAKRGLIPA